MKKFLNFTFCILVMSLTLISCRESTTEKETVRTETVVKEEKAPVAQEEAPSKVSIKMNDKGDVEGEVNID